MSEAPSGKQVPSPDEILDQHRRRGTLRVAQRAGVLALLAAAALGVLILLGEDTGDAAALVGLALLVSGYLDLNRRWARLRVSACRALLDLGHHDAAIAELKTLLDVSSAADEARYLIALAYDRRGDETLALESYRRYLREHADGAWTVESQVRVDALAPPAPPQQRRTGLIPAVLNALGVPTLQPQAAPPPSQAAPPDVEVRQGAADERVICPFCKDRVVSEALSAECADCGTPHHLGCYEEQGGCSVYGCRSRKAKARIRDV